MKFLGLIFVDLSKLRESRPRAPRLSRGLGMGNTHQPYIYYIPQTGCGLPSSKKNSRRRAEKSSFADVGLSSKSQHGAKNESKRIGVGLDLASTLVRPVRAAPLRLCGVRHGCSFRSTVLHLGPQCCVLAGIGRKVAVSSIFGAERSGSTGQGPFWQECGGSLPDCARRKKPEPIMKPV